MPAWLLLITMLGGGVVAVEVLNLALLVMSGLLIGDALRRLGMPWPGIAAAGLVVFNPILSGLAGTLYSETLFTTLSLVAMWALLRADLVAGIQTRRWVTMAVTFALLAFLVRTIGVAIIAAVFAVLLLRRWWRWAATTAAVSVIVVGGWFTYVTIAARGTERSYIADLAVAPEYSLGGGLLPRIVDHLQFYLVEGMAQLFGLPMMPGTILDNVAWTMLLLGTSVIGLLWMVRRWPAALLSFLLTGAILLIWPWALARLAAPLVPIGIGAMLAGASQVGWRLPAIGLKRVVIVAVTTALFFSASQRHADRWISRSTCAPEYLAGNHAGCRHIQDRALMLASRLARERLPASAVIAAEKESTVYYWSGHRVVSINRLDHDFDDVAVAMREIGATHILLGRMYPRSAERLGPRLQAVCDQLVEVEAIDAPAALLAPRKPGDGDACDAIKRVLSWEIPDQ